MRLNEISQDLGSLFFHIYLLIFSSDNLDMREKNRWAKNRWSSKKNGGVRRVRPHLDPSLQNNVDVMTLALHFQGKIYVVIFRI